MKVLFFLFVSGFAFGQNFDNWEIEQMLAEHQFVEAIKVLDLRMDQKKYVNTDELNSCISLKHLATAGLLWQHSGSTKQILKELEEANFYLRNCKSFENKKRLSFYNFYADFISKSENNNLKAAFCKKNIIYLKKSNQSDLELAVYSALYALVLKNTYETAESIRYGEKALEIFKKLQLTDSFMFGVVNYQLGFVYSSQGRADKGEQYFLFAANTLENCKDPSSYIVLTKVYEMLVASKATYGDDKVAAGYLRKHQVILSKMIAENKPKVYDYLEVKIRFFASSIYLYSFYDEYKMTEGVNNLQKIIDLDNLGNYSPDIVYMFTPSFANAALYHRYNKNHQKAIEIDELLISKLKGTKNVHFSYFFYANLAYVYSDLQENNKALEAIEMAIFYAKKDRHYTTDYETLRSELLSKTNKDSDAKLNALAIINKMTVTGVQYKNLSAIDAKDFEGLSSEYGILIFNSIARIYQNGPFDADRTANLKIAFKLYEIASKMFNSYYKKDIYNPALSKLILNINQGLLATSSKLQINNPAMLLSLVESNASKYLWNEFVIKNPTIDFGSANKSIEELKRIRIEKNKIISKKNVGTDNKSNNAGYFNKQIVILQQTEKKLISNIKRDNSEYFNFSNASIDINKIQSKLTDNQTLLRFVVTSKDVYVFEINKFKIDFRYVGTRTFVVDKVRELDQHLRKSQTAFGKLGQDLYEIFRINYIKRGNSIIIVADDFLNYLPFEILQDATGRYLVQSHTVSYLSSLLFFNNKFKTSESKQSRLVAFAPLYSKKLLQGNLDGLDNNNLKELKGAHNEARQIANQFSGDLFEGKRAVKVKFLQDAHKYKIIHLAMHSILDQNNPENSSLVFHGNQKLYFSELYKIQIPADLVVLSACNTGNGALLSGEGIISLSRAFVFAGVKSCVYSLWQVPDKETSEIMISFYENLKKGQAKDEALANAKKEFIKNNPMKNHPFYWAGFVVNGDLSPIMSSNNGLMYLAIVVAIVVLLFAFRKKINLYSCLAKTQRRQVSN